jgi:poly(beta-D-mannuronate) lyase
MAGVTAKYVRIVGHGNSVNAWNSYTEVKIQTSSGSRTITPAPRTMAPVETPVVTRSKVKLNSYPNPFRESSTITFSLPAPGHTQLAVFDITGKQVAALVNGYLQAGDHRALLTTHPLPAGVYILKLVHNGNTITKKLVKE